jgi:hypothetical protein
MGDVFPRNAIKQDLGVGYGKLGQDPVNPRTGKS